MKYHAEKHEDVTQHLSSDIHAGLTSEEVKRRLEQQGYNEMPSGEEHGPVFIFFKQFHSFLIYILLAAALLAFLFDHLVDVYVILAVIFLNAVMGFVQEYKAEKAIKALKKMVVPHARVFRGGELIQVQARELVIGDILFLEEGDRIPADARLLEIKHFRTEEASLTGESFPIDKDVKPLPPDTGVSDRKNMVWMGTFVVGGQAKAVVTAKGTRTALGEIAKSMKEIKYEKGHFEKKTDKLAKQMGVIAIAAATFIFLIGFFLRNFGFGEIFLFTVASLVSSIPEGLPAVLVVVLAVGVHRMAQRNAIIRRLPATETLGVINVIATDKTGTITQNTMNIEKIMLPGEESISVTGDGWVPEGEFKQGGEPMFPLEHPPLAKLLHIASACNNARLIKKKDETYEILGDPTEASLVVLGEKAGLDREVIQEKEKRIDDIPFNSELKYRASLSVLTEEEGEKEIYVVGAPEEILSVSSHYVESGEVKKLDEKKKDEITKRIGLLTKDALRVIALAYKPVGEEVNNVSEDMVCELVFTGLVGMKDPPREGV